MFDLFLLVLSVPGMKSRLFWLEKLVHEICVFWVSWFLKSIAARPYFLFNVLVWTNRLNFLINLLIFLFYLQVSGWRPQKIGFLFIVLMHIRNKTIVFELFFEWISLPIIDFFDLPKMLQVHFLPHFIADQIIVHSKRHCLVLLGNN